MTTVEQTDQEPTGEGEQESYLPPIVPPEFIRPPGEQQFANATWMHAGPEIRRLVQEVLAFDEFSELAALPYSIVWRRKSHPMMGEMPIFVTVEPTKPRDVWEATQREDPDFPQFYVDLHWQHFNDLVNGLQPGERDTGENPEGRGAQYVHEGILQQHIHYAMSGWEVDNGIMHKRAPDFMGFAKNVERFGLWNEGLVVAYRQLHLWGQKGDEPEAER